MLLWSQIVAKCEEGSAVPFVKTLSMLIWDTRMVNFQICGERMKEWKKDEMSSSLKYLYAGSVLILP